MRLTIKAPGDLSAFGITLSQNRIGAHLSGTLGLFRSIALGLMSALMIGVLKGSSLVSVVAIGGLCAGLVTFGVKVFLDGPAPSYLTILGWSVFMIALAIILFFLGQAG